ncbi:MAG: bifunctional 4-hydroxy-2-oxoglutarate aldolase/2-dehydro-3-deoxy-phosphogluconate aldolase [Sphaerochaetaceae bacterium]|nr:bifunctional 4-hydroxy-2-oxoglutarate aldolase/2-dehydro-3-deoxy-phosphogluconate aldolase [Sphaerochaetaceae bacterium]
MDLLQRIEQTKIVAILRGIDPDRMLKTAHALYDGGIRLIEVTFDQKSRDFEKTASAIKALCTEFGSSMDVGAGTVTSTALVRLAADSGAGFIISPDTNVDVIRMTKSLGLVSMPGAMTPSEIIQAHEAGADFVKVFPAGVLGPDYIKAVRGPISNVRLLAVGGVDESNIAAFLKAGCVGAGIGGSLARKECIDAQQYDKLKEAAIRLLSAMRG